MKKIALMVTTLLAVNHFVPFDLNSLAHISDYAIALLVALMIQPWVVNQFDS